MNEEETVEPQMDVMLETAQEAEQVQDGAQESQHTESRETQVPLSALQKERKKRQEVEQELQWERNRQMQQSQQSQAPIEEDNSRYESATREDLSKAQNEAIRAIEERMWVKANPEKFEKINEYLPQFLKQRPNLTMAINGATNRYEEAYTLMEALTPKQQAQLKPTAAPRKDAPGSPTGVPKAAAMNQAVDVMTMNDNEFAAWRQSQKRKR